MKFANVFIFFGAWLTVQTCRLLVWPVHEVQSKSGECRGAGCGLKRATSKDVSWTVLDGPHITDDPDMEQSGCIPVDGS